MCFRHRELNSRYPKMRCCAARQGFLNPSRALIASDKPDDGLVAAHDGGIDRHASGTAAQQQKRLTWWSE